MTRVTQVIAAASPGDAITGQAFAWQRLLAEWGRPSDVVAEHVHPSLARRVRRLDEDGGARLREGAVILHYSVWSATVGAALAGPGPVAIVYHNVTPGALLREANPVLADACDRARAALPDLRERAEVFVADSAFNAAELEALGIDAQVVPLLLEFPRELGSTEREPGAPPTVISVGRIVPNKRLEDVIGAFHLYKGHRAPNASLILVGAADGFELYRAALEGLIRKLGVRDVIFAGRVSDDERDRLYRTADAYLCMSVHEGFCAPLVEAMAHGVPIVARRAGAIPETVGAAGIVVDRDLPLVAEALHEVVTSEPTRRGLAATARARLADLDPRVTGERLRAALAPILSP